MSGTVYGIGVGPGAPDLLTLRAARLIERAEVIAYPVLERGESFARSIVAEILPKGITEIAMTIPMSVERGPAQAAYDTGAKQIAAHLDAGRDVVVLCEGDPLFFGSFMYIQSRLADRFEVKVVPGVTSLTTVAAATNLPLAARNEVLTIIPGPLSEEALAAHIKGAQSLAIMKVGRHLPKIKRVIESLGLMDHAMFVERASLPNERVAPLAEVETAPYFSMILLTKGDDPWL